MDSLIEGLDGVLGSTRNPGLRELRELLADVLGCSTAPGHVLEEHRLSRDRVFRMRFEVEDGARSLIVKRLPVERSLRERLAITSWLPRAGFGRSTPTLLGVAADPRGGQVWHVYADLGGCTLNQVAFDATKVRAAVELIAGIHRRFTGHPLLAECRLVGMDVGTGFFASSVADAVRGLDAMRRLESVQGVRRNLVERLLHRLAAHREERFERTREAVELGWPETLQHGDLWATNVLVPSGEAAPDVRLIDWEYAGVGPAIYDLSTFLRQLPPPDRAGVVDAYRECVTPAGWAWPGDTAFNRMAETVELGRYANCIIWPTIVALAGDPVATPDWVFEELIEIETWFLRLGPLLPSPDGEDQELQAS